MDERQESRGEKISRKAIVRSLRTLAARFWRNVEKTDGCWLWKATSAAQGYGVLRKAGKFVGAHRISWELHFGEIPEGMCVLHRCDNPPCVRPDHLFLGTRADNSADKVSKGRQSKGSLHGHALLTEEQVIELRRLYVEERTSYRELAIRFGIERRTVEPILRGVVYRDATDSVNVQAEYGSEEWKQRISDAEKGKPFTEEHLANLRAAHAARRGTDRSVPWNKGVPTPEKTRLKISAARKGQGGGRALDPQAEIERAHKISEARKRYWAAKKAAAASPALSP